MVSFNKQHSQNSCINTNWYLFFRIHCPHQFSSFKFDNIISLRNYTKYFIVPIHRIFSQTPNFPTKSEKNCKFLDSSLLSIQKGKVNALHSFSRHKYSTKSILCRKLRFQYCRNQCCRKLRFLKNCLFGILHLVEFVKLGCWMW